MAEKDPIDNDTTVNQEALQEAYLKTLDTLEEGQVIEGQVIAVTNESVMIDIGYKSDGNIPLEEFETKPEVGETVRVILLQKETKSGGIRISKRQVDAIEFRQKLKEAAENHGTVFGTIKKSIKGGFDVDLGYGFKAFLPISKADVNRVEDPETLIGTESDFYIEKLVLDRKTNIVVNRRDLLAEIVDARRESFFEEVQIGDEVEGVIKSFTSFGAFIDLGGFDGLLHINDMSWGHVTRPKDYVKKGDAIRLKVIRLDPDEKKINLSLKHFTEDPWARFEDKYHVDQVVQGKVTKLTDFGAFIEIEEGIEGLAHISEFSWIKRVKHPKELVSIGDEVEAKILEYNVQQGRISLGLKQVQSDPWDEIKDKYPIGKVMNLEVKKITNAGAFLTLEEGIDGFLHVDDLSWTKKIKNPGSVLKEGESVDVKIIDLDLKTKRIRLGMKQVSEDPWGKLREKFPRGSVIEGEITSKQDFGVFVKVEGEIEGLINKNNLCDSRDKDPEEVLKQMNVGDKVKALITDISPEKGKLSLSIRDMIAKEQKAEMSKYIHNDEKEEGGFTLGDILKTDE
jgi:small subunit ribosomal protein S1